MEVPGLTPEIIQRQQAHQAAIAANFCEASEPILRGEAEQVSLRVTERERAQIHDNTRQWLKNSRRKTT